MSGARVVRVAGVVVQARPAAGVALYELARVGHRRLLGEVIRVDGDTATLQVYEDTTGLAVGEPVAWTGAPLLAELGPGLLGSVLDGVGRPLAALAAAGRDFVTPGLDAPPLDRARTWDFEPEVRPGDAVAEGDRLGRVQEQPAIRHAVLVPPGVRGTVAEVAGPGPVTVETPVARLEDGTPLRLAQRWPVRRARPCAERLGFERPFLTRQRLLDLLFPLAEGGSAAVPGGFGTGKTILEQSLAKHADADVVVFVGCGERGNEMADLLAEFPSLEDPRTGRPLLERTVLVVNTSNMPVAARESSIYLGITIAEYYRDMGYRVALLVDSISRWAEALREIAGRLQEMPGEEGFPTYLASRLGQFYERAGRARTLGRPQRTGAVTVISTVSPPGGDFSEPVTQACLRVTGALWALDAGLARQRHFPAVDWETSYSLYADDAGRGLAETVAPDWPEVRRAVLALLERDRELREIASLVGRDALEDRDRFLLEIAAIVREVVLRQNAFHPHDAASAPAKTYRLAALACAAYANGLRALEEGLPADALPLAPLRLALAALRDAPEPELEARAEAARAAAEALGPNPARP
jgi:V/A-type H+-transporting ATPase subunit A